MRTPLVTKQEAISGRSHSAQCQAIFIFVSLAILSLALFPLKSTLALAEEKVGAPPDWKPIVSTYFGMGSLTQQADLGHAYIGTENPVVPKQNCNPRSECPMCKEVCRDMLEAADPRLSSIFNEGASLEREGSSKAFASYCLKRNRATQEWDCWDTSTMRCWNAIYGGNLVLSGGQDWTLSRHYLGYHEPLPEGIESISIAEKKKHKDIRWMHLFTSTQELVLFGWGKVRPFDQICEDIEDFSELKELLHKFVKGRSLILGGHSEGSGWAICFRKFLLANGFEDPIYVITTGTLVPERHFIDGLDDSIFEKSLHLNVAMVIPSIICPIPVLPDILTLVKPRQGMTLPQFGYQCNMEFHCLNFDQTLDFAAPLDAIYSNTFTNAEWLMQDVHSFRNYRECYKGCLQHFTQTPGFNFQTNTPSFEKFARESASPSPHGSPNAASPPGSGISLADLAMALHGPQQTPSTSGQNTPAFPTDLDPSLGTPPT